ncbi:hypothetical protein MLD63_16160 [Paracoccus sp. TK19116]|uniref:Uncharacterized protein n=1 Tax=Paracoccus albicereus TaxID=2922394 RepID=A0ABT1MXA1_9RHOB|nr:hypothetical protein [Paracoccus albicereus]MCQ0971958.1 hypothetical protein [Paracoccus albicereus]
MRATLSALPPKEKTTFTNRETVTALAAEILHARGALGYSVEDIAMMLAEHGIEIKPATLRGYLREVAKSTPAKTVKRRGKPGATVTAAAPLQIDSGIGCESAAADAAAPLRGFDG